MSRSKEYERLSQLAHELYPDLDTRLDVMLQIHRQLDRLDDEGKLSTVEFLLLENMLTPEAKQRLIKAVDEEAQVFVKGTAEKQ